MKLEKKFYVTEGPTGRRFQLPLTTMNFKVAQLLETYLEEVAKDSSIPLGRFISLADLVAEFPRDSDDALYKAIDTFLRVSPKPYTMRCFFVSKWFSVLSYDLIRFSL